MVIVGVPKNILAFIYTLCTQRVPRERLIATVQDARVHAIPSGYGSEFVALHRLQTKTPFYLLYTVKTLCIEKFDA